MVHGTSVSPGHLFPGICENRENPEKTIAANKVKYFMTDKLILLRYEFFRSTAKM